ncbi:MAG: stage III sporulation protein AE [Oscillospiraceae bacterium]
MKRRWMKNAVCLILLAIFLCGGCLAAGESILREQAEGLPLDELENAAGEYGDGLDIAEGISFEEGIRSLTDRGSAALEGVLKDAARSGVLILAVVLLCGLAEGMGAATEGRTMAGASIVCAIAIAAIAAADAKSLIGMGRSAIDSMDAFSKVLLPVMAATSVASGSPAGGAAAHIATMLFSDVLITAISRFLLPMVYALIAASTACAALGNEGLKRIAELLKWAVTTALTAILICFTGYLTISGAIAGTADATTVKAAKFALSSVVPVVGSILSDAAETVLAGAGILKSAVGVFGMLAVMGMCLLPFLHLAVHYLVYKAVAALAATVADSRAASLIDSIGGAFGLVLGMTASCAVLLLISMVSGISAVLR